MGENDGAKLPPDPMTAMAELASNLHEVFIAYVAAGFTEGQAIYLVGQILRGGMQQGTPGD